MKMLTRRVRGFRIIEVVGIGLLIAVVLTVYLGKTFAGKERNQIASVEKDIATEQEKVRLLKAEVSYLEQPSRLERLSTGYLGLQPISAKHETTPEALAALAHSPLAKPAAPMIAMAISPMPAAAPAPTPVSAPAPVAKPAQAKLIKVAGGAPRGGLTP